MTGAGASRPRVYGFFLISGGRDAPAPFYFTFCYWLKRMGIEPSNQSLLWLFTTIR